MNSRTLRSSLAIPSTVHTYSVITEYIQKWFVSRWSNKYFKTIHIEGKHVFDDYRNYDFSSNLRVDKPALAILPKLELEYNRDYLDSNMFGINRIVENGRLDNALIKDFDRDLFIGHGMKLLDINYVFKIRVESRAQQIDLYEYMSMAFRVGHRYTEEVNMDYHIPYKMMLQLARDVGFEIVDNKIIDIVSFLNYVNSKSELPVLFKLRTINQKMEFFIRYNDLEIAIDIPDRISADDGERQGQLDNNFHLEMNVNLRAPSPKLYVYYSRNDQDIDTVEEAVFPDPIYVNSGYETVLTKLPKTNSNGWNQYLITTYYEEEFKDGMEIDLSELFTSLDMDKLIDLHIETAIDSSNYITFYIINAEIPDIPYTIDWNDRKMHISQSLDSSTCTIGLYMDTEYINNMKITLKNMNKQRYNLEKENRNR